MRRTPRLAAGVLALAAASLTAQGLGSAAREARDAWPTEESYVTLPPAEAARFGYLGYNELAADVTWARLLVYYGSGFLGEGDFRYLGNFVDNIIVLDPQFKKVYEWASYSVTVNEKRQVSTHEDDMRKSIAILEKAMVAFPDEYEFFWLAGARASMLRSVKQVAGEGIAAELKRATEEFSELRLEHGQQIPEHIFVILNGPPPSPVIDFDSLATDRDLLGSQEHQDAPLFGQ